uniref:Uncharacterized protein n=1 Tax=Steinernema glaseri TaxID=37863 RepID=A0A1I7YLQ3_9BILA
MQCLSLLVPALHFKFHFRANSNQFLDHFQTLSEVISLTLHGLTSDLDNKKPICYNAGKPVQSNLYSQRTRVVVVPYRKWESRGTGFWTTFGGHYLRTADAASLDGWNFNARGAFKSLIEGRYCAVPAAYPKMSALFDGSYLQKLNFKA